MSKRLKGIFIIVTTSFLLSSTLLANGNDLLHDCLIAEKYIDTESMPNVLEALSIGNCLGLGQGVRNSMQLIDDKKRACFPNNGIVNTQATRIIVSYLKKNPGKLHKSEVFLIMRAYMDAYPCN